MAVHIEIIIYTIAEIARNLSRYRTILQFPTEEDLKGTAEALLRVQKTYNINASSIANGDFGDSSPYRLVFCLIDELYLQLTYHKLYLVIKCHQMIAIYWLIIRQRNLTTALQSSGFARRWQDYRIKILSGNWTYTGD